MPIGKAFLVLVCVALTLSGCATSSWQDVGGAKLSADERTLTVDLLFGAPEGSAKLCERVTDTELNESPSQVVIGILVEKDCPRQWPWEEPVYSNLVGYRHPVTFTLKRSLAGRTVINNTDGQRVRIYPEESKSR
ncbi:hypothetical protein AB0392_26455 [Nonomuraea angiospora]|uniref:hypothetical protein n=1 Tax=Nonomuraea angiospora TaxID=46172 RepID=UPI00345081D7